MPERNAVMRDADEAVRMLVDKIHDQVEQLPDGARSLWWEAFATGVYAMVAASTGYEESLRIFDHMLENARGSEDYVKDQLKRLGRAG